MNTDKEVYQIIRSCPELIFQLAKIDFPGPGKVESVTVKALQRTMDVLYRPDDPKAPLYVIEIQFQKSEDIYQRLVTELAMLQTSNKGREVVGIILFADKSLDPQTAPWTKVVRSIYLDEMLSDLESENALHPLVAVFKPVFENSESELEKRAAEYYRSIKSSPLDSTQRDALLEVFINWMIERLGNTSRKELNMILELPDIKDTVCGRELLEEGIEQGLQKGLQKGRQEGESQMIIRFLEEKFGRIPDDQLEILKELSETRSNLLIGELASGSLEDLDALKRWLSSS